MITEENIEKEVAQDSEEENADGDDVAAEDSTDENASSNEVSE